MGIILSSRILPDDKVKIKICLDEEEALSLGGCIRDIGIFASDLCDVESRVIERGTRGITKHFLVPIKLRSKIKKQAFGIKCSKVESKNKVMFVYVVDRKGNVLFD